MCYMMWMQYWMCYNINNPILVNILLVCTIKSWKSCSVIRATGVLPLEGKINFSLQLHSCAFPFSLLLIPCIVTMNGNMFLVNSASKLGLKKPIVLVLFELLTHYKCMCTIRCDNLCFLTPNPVQEEKSFLLRWQPVTVAASKETCHFVTALCLFPPVLCHATPWLKTDGAYRSSITAVNIQARSNWVAKVPLAPAVVIWAVMLGL